MKTLKILTTRLMLLACFNLLSCSNDDDDDNTSDTASIVGTWQYKEGDDFIETLTLDEDGSFQEISKEYYKGKWDVDTDYGEYEYKKNTLTLYYSDGESYSLKVISLTSKTLKVEDEGDVLTYQRK